MIDAISRFIILILFWPLTVIVKSYTYLSTYKTLKSFKSELRNDTTHSEWISTVKQIDHFLGKDKWRENQESKKYDYQLINDRLITLQTARRNRDIAMIVSLFNSGLIRNFGGITDKNLFSNSYMGTKLLIHQYIEEVLKCLEFIYEYRDLSKGLNVTDAKLQFFHNAKQTFGSTALILQGGSMFGMFHLGVIKALCVNNLLPKIVSGSYFGAIFACLACSECTLDSTIDFDKFKDDLVSFGETFEPHVFVKREEFSLELMSRFFQKSSTPEIYLLMKYVDAKLGNVTFEELYNQSGRVLNLMVYSTDKSLPPILNHITSPNIVVRSAMFACIGTDIMGPVQILMKNLSNKVVPWNTFNAGDVAKNVRFSGPHEFGKDEFKSPYERLTELFNVNHFIVSLARLYFKPLVINDLRHDLHFVKPLSNMEQIIEEAKERMEEKGQDFPISFSRKDLNYFEIWLLPLTIVVSVLVNIIASIITFIATPSYTYINATKMIQKIINMEIQYRFNLLADLEMFKKFKIFQLVKKLTVDERTPKLSSSEITIVPNVRDFFKIWSSIFLSDEITPQSMKDNISFATNNGERSVWALLPILEVRCTIEFELDRLYTNTKRMRDI